MKDHNVYHYLAQWLKEYLPTLKEKVPENSYTADYIIEMMNTSFILPSLETPERWTYPMSYDYDDVIDFDTRRKMKLGRLLKRRLQIDAPDHVINKIVNALNVGVPIWAEHRQQEQESMIREVKGPDIQLAYDEVNVDSCMTGRNVKLYCDNPDTVSLVRYGDEGRALLWTVNGERYMDRIYPNDVNHAVHQKIRAYGEQTDCYIRDHHSMPAGSVLFQKPQEVKVLDLSLNFSGEMDEYSWPYLDSLRYVTDVNIYDCRIYLTSDYSSDFIHVLDSTDGSYDSDDDPF